MDARQVLQSTLAPGTFYGPSHRLKVESSTFTPRHPMSLPLVDCLCLQMRRNVPMLNSSSPTPLRSTSYVIP